MRKRKVSKLQKLLTSNENTTYETTLEDCQRWFRILNKEIFDSKLPPVDEIDIRWRRKTYAFYYYEMDTKDPNFMVCKLCMNKRYKNKKFFVEVLAHEMVHHYQFMFDEPVSHGPTFTAWCDKFNKKGLKLVRAYEDESQKPK